MRSYMDLHVHSRYSDDGEFSPQALVDAYKNHGIQVMSIADHNSVRGNKEAEAAAQSVGITYVPGIEIDCTFQGINLHLLGYGIDSTAQEFSLLEESLLEQSRRASLVLFQKIINHGFQITREEVEALEQGIENPGCWTGELFAEALLANPLNDDNPLLLPYRQGGERSDNPYVNFYWDFCSQGKPCYVEILYPTLAEATAMIRKNGGVSVLAHPGMNLRQRPELLDPILSVGVEGIEAFSSYHTTEQAAAFSQAASQRGLLITCGSDYHGKIKPSIHPGDTRCTLDESTLWLRLKERLTR